MSNQAPRILVGDKDDGRFERLSHILETSFRTRGVHRERSFDDLERKVIDSTWGIVFLADDLPEVRDKDVVNLAGCVNRLRGVYAGPIVCIVSSDEDPELIDGVTIYIHLAASASRKKSDKAASNVITQLKVLGKRLPEYPKNPQIKLPDDPVLREQLRSLNDDRNLNEGIKNVASIVREFFDCDKVDVGKLGQGKSGSRVFLVQPKRAKKDLGEYVLKLVPSRDRWKLEREVERHNKARDYLAKGSIKSFIPELVTPLQPDDANHPNLKFAVFYKQWYAICYEFLGGIALGRVLDLETALIADPEKLTPLLDGTHINAASTNETRTSVLETQLSRLCDLWYMNSKLTDRVSRSLWSYEDRAPEDYPSLPPYKLTGKNKGYILSFLDSQAAEMGGDFFDNWDKSVDAVRSFLERGYKRSKADRLLSRDSLVVVSPTHGDLNSNNLLLWVEEKDHPLLIDFPMYDEEGHALQDFAKIETEIKFMVMDRQRGVASGRPRAFDYTYSQLPLWGEMENLLLASSWDAPVKGFTNSGHQENVLFCFGLIQLVRKKAERVQQQALGVSSSLTFLEEYYPPLLFHTLRAIGYESLSVFKRLLAVYSASCLIEKLS